MAENENGTNQQNAENQAIEARIGHEGRMRLPVKNGGHKARQNQKEHHGPEDRHGA